MSAPVIDRFPGALSSAHVSMYEENGYLAFENFLPKQLLNEALSGITQIINMRHADKGPVIGKKSEIYSKYMPLGERRPYIQIEPSLSEMVKEGADIELWVKKLMNIENISPFNIVVSMKTLLDVRDRLLGVGSTLILSVIQMKPPLFGSKKCWHQDNAYFSIVPIDHVMTIWVPLDYATVDNGCIHVIPGAHTGGPLRHAFHGDCEIASEEIDISHAVPVPLSPGGAILFNGLLPHYTAPNRTTTRRRAIQLHFRTANSRLVSPDEFSKTFVDRDGRPADCSAAARLASPEVGARWVD